MNRAYRKRHFAMTQAPTEWCLTDKTRKRMTGNVQRKRVYDALIAIERRQQEAARRAARRRYHSHHQPGG